MDARLETTCRAGLTRLSFKATCQPTYRRHRRRRQIYGLTRTLQCTVHLHITAPNPGFPSRCTVFKCAQLHEILHLEKFEMTFKCIKDSGNHGM